MGSPIGEILIKKPLKLEDLNGRRVGVDSFNVLYQFLSSIRGEDGNPLMDQKGRITSHLSGLFYRTSNWMQMGILPVFVFDGEAHPLKAETREKRREIRTTAVGELVQAQEAEDEQAIQKTAGQAVKMTGEIIGDAKRLVELLGLPVVQAAGEGEAQLAVMVEKGDLFCAISQDYDSLLFGMPRLVRNVALSGKRKVPGKSYSFTIEPEIIDLQENLKTLGLSREQLIWLGMLVGTDFNPKMPRIGAKTALKKVLQAKRWEEIVSTIPDAIPFEYSTVEKLFQNPPFFGDYQLEFKEPDREKLMSFLVNEHDFSRDRVESTLNRLIETMKKKKSQTNLFAWN